MKTIEKILKTLLILLISTNFIIAQNQHYRIHVDHVYPSSSDAYEKISKKLADLAKENQEEDSWNVLWTNDNKVISIAPVAGWEDLGKEFMPKTRAKLGDEKFREIFQEFDKHYDYHNDYIITLNNELSYMPDGMTTTPKGKDFRKNTLMYFKARDLEKVTEIAGKFKELYTKKGSKSHYRVYFSGFGNPESYIMVASAAENALEHAKQADANNKLLGEDSKALWDELTRYVTRIEHMEGNMVPGLSYSPVKP